MQNCQWHHWDPPELEPNKATRHTVAVHGCSPGDIAVASHTGIGAEQLVQLSATAHADSVVVVLRNADEVAVDVALGELRIVVSAFV